MFTATKDDNISNLKSSAQNLRDNASAVANDAGDDLREVANKAGRKVRGFINTASDEITHARDTVTSEIRSNPVQSSLVALGVGYLLGALLRR